MQRFIWQLNFVNIGKEFFLWISACFSFCLICFFHIVCQRDCFFIHYKQLQQHSNIYWISANKKTSEFPLHKKWFLRYWSFIYCLYLFLIIFSWFFLKKILFSDSWCFYCWSFIFGNFFSHLVLRLFFICVKLFLMAFLFFFFLCNLRDISIF